MLHASAQRCRGFAQARAAQRLGSSHCQCAGTPPPRSRCAHYRSQQRPQQRPQQSPGPADQQVCLRRHCHCHCRVTLVTRESWCASARSRQAQAGRRGRCPQTPMTHATSAMAALPRGVHRHCRDAPHCCPNSHCRDRARTMLGQAAHEQRPEGRPLQLRCLAQVARAAGRARPLLRRVLVGPIASTGARRRAARRWRCWRHRRCARRTARAARRCVAPWCRVWGGWVRAVEVQRTVTICDRRDPRLLCAGVKAVFTSPSERTTSHHNVLCATHRGSRATAAHTRRVMPTRGRRV